MTGTPRPTASLMAPVTFPASEQEIRMASAPLLTACWMRCAWIWPSSSGGVSHSTSTWILSESESSLAAASAPVREARKTGLFELLAIIAILRWPLVDAPGLGEQAEGAEKENKGDTGGAAGGRG